LSQAEIDGLYAEGICTAPTRSRRRRLSRLIHNDLGASPRTRSRSMVGARSVQFQMKA
jgi:hypothetical protein